MKPSFKFILLTISAILLTGPASKAQLASYSIVGPDSTALSNIAAQFITANEQVAATSDGQGVLATPQPIAGEFILAVENSQIIPTYFFETDWSPRRLIVNSQTSQNIVHVAGTTQGFQPKNLDGQVDFAMVMSALKKSDVLGFDLRKILSPESDVVKIYTTEFKIPSNLTLPRQTELFILPIVLDKPSFRLDLPLQNGFNIFTVRGQFNLQQVMQGSTGSTSQMYLLLNYLKLNGGSLRSISSANIAKPLNLPVNELAFTDAKAVPLPSLAADEKLLAMALNKQNEFYLPSDMKLTNNVGQRNLQLNFIPQSKPYVAYVIKKQNELDPEAPGLDRLTLQLAPVGTAVALETIPMLDTPMVTADGRLQMTIPAKPSSLHSFRQLVQVSKITVTMKDGKESKKYERVAEMWSQDWQANLPFPKPLAELCERCRIDVSLMGSTEENIANDEIQWIEKATHVSHVSLEN